MKRNIIKSAALAIILASATAVMADDMIVMRNGDIVAARVTDITPTEVKYKKASNPNGPTYTILKSDILAINYENGEKETFDAAPVASASSAPAQNRKANPNNEYNRQAIARFNKVPQYTKDDTDKKAGEAFFMFYPTEGSVLADEEIEIIVEEGRRFLPYNGGKDKLSPYEPYPGGNYVKLIIKNNTDKTIYVDLANSFINRNGMSEPLYIPSVTTTTTGSGSSGAVNLGSLTGGLLGGITLGGSSSSASTTTEIAQRVVAVPPHSKLSLPAVNKEFSDRDWDTWANYDIPRNAFYDNYPDPGVHKGKYQGIKVYKLNFPKNQPLMRGEIIEYPEDMIKYRLGFRVSISDNEDCTGLKSYDFQFYPKYVLGVSGLGRGMAKFLKNNPQYEGLFGDVWWYLDDNDSKPSYPR